MEQKMKKQPSLLKQLFVFAGNYKYLSILSVFFAGISALAALVPFYCICRIMHEVLRVKLDFPRLRESSPMAGTQWALLSLACFLFFYTIIPRL